MFFDYEEFKSLAEKENLIVDRNEYGAVYFGDEKTGGKKLLGYVEPSFNYKTMYIKIPKKEQIDLDEFKNTKEMVDYIIKNSKKSSRKSMKESTESDLIDSVATKLRKEKIIDGKIDTYRGADWIYIIKGDYKIETYYRRRELWIGLYNIYGEFLNDSKLESAYSPSDDDFSVNYVIDFIKNFIKERSYLKKEFSIKESMNESKNDMIEVTEVNPILPWWVYDKHRKVYNDIIDMIWYKKKFDIFVPDRLSKELYFVNDDITVICTEDNIQFVIHNVNKNTEFLTTLTYVGYYKSSVEIDGYVDKGYYGAFLEDFLNILYHWK